MDIEPLDIHAPLWARIQPFFEHPSFPQALLFSGARHVRMLQFVNRLIARLMCSKAAAAPCHTCQACYLFMQQTHPDVCYMHQETSTSAIKVDQVRGLQQDVYQTPQIGARRFIVIEPADAMNAPAANALLKILEEPPAHTTLILIAEQLDGLPLTILSRCQQYVFSAPIHSKSIYDTNYLQLAEFYQDDSHRARLLQQRHLILTQLGNICSGQTLPTAFAAEWSAYDLSDLLWIFYLITANAIRRQLLGSNDAAQDETSCLYHLTPVQLLSQLDCIQDLLRHVRAHISLNQTLAIEKLLLGYMPPS